MCVNKRKVKFYSKDGDGKREAEEEEVNKRG